MNDNTSNTPDNASRPGPAAHPSRRVRDKNGRFIPKKRNTDTPGSVEETRNQPLAGSHGEVTVGEFLDQVRNHQESDPVLGNLLREVDEKNRKSVEGHTRRSKGKRAPRVDYEDAARSIRFYQVRSIAGTRKFGLFYADGVKWDDPTRSAKDLVQHWFGLGGYEAHHANAAVHFDSAREAKDFRRKNFKLPVGFNAQEMKYEQNNEAKRTLTETVGRRGKCPSHTTSKKVRVNR